MTSVEQNNDRDEIIQVLRAYHRAMVEARTEDLNTFVAKDYSLAHITGYVQPKEEWFGVIRSKQFDYHSITIEENALSVTITGSTATLAGRGIFNATINGISSSWRLQFMMRYAKQDDKWIITHARYTSF